MANGGDVKDEKKSEFGGENMENGNEETSEAKTGNLPPVFESESAVRSV